MSKNVTILEGGQARAFGHVQKLKTTKSGGGSVLWVDEDEVDTKSLYATTNGTYVAADGSYVKTVKYKENGKKKTKKVIKKDPNQACYGYDKVEVNIIDGVKGYKDKGGIDSPYDVWVDDDGFLVEDELPVRIEITTPPSKTSYTTGETINTAGMVVKAYYADGSEWGEVPLDELTLEPSTAPTISEITLDGENVHFFVNAPSSAIYETNPFGYLPIGGSITFEGTTVSTRLGLDGYVYKSVNGVEQSSRWNQSAFPALLVRHVRKYSDDDWQNALVGLRTADYVGLATQTYSFHDFRAAVIGEGQGGEITVSWLPSDDTEELTDTFEITVTDSTPTPVGGHPSEQ